MDDKLKASLGLISAFSFMQASPEGLLHLIAGLSFLQTILLLITGSIFIGKVSFEGWASKTPVYLVKCREHGYQLTYPQGHMANLVCPKCALKVYQ
jgi:hypothetical protein